MQQIWNLLEWCAIGVIVLAMFAGLRGMCLDEPKPWAFIAMFWAMSYLNKGRV